MVVWREDGLLIECWPVLLTSDIRGSTRPTLFTLLVLHFFYYVQIFLAISLILFLVFPVEKRSSEISEGGG